MKKFVAMILSVVMVFAFASTAMAYDEDVNKDLAVTRAEFVDIIYRIESALVGKLYDCPNVFSDVKTDSLHENAISWAAVAGVVNGTSYTTFNPDDYITREQMATMVHRYYKYKVIAPVGAWATRIDANDAANVSPYAVEGVMFAIINDMLKKDANGNINPQGVVTGDELRDVIGNFYFNEIK